MDTASLEEMSEGEASGQAGTVPLSSGSCVRGEGGLLRGYRGPDGDAKKLKDGPEVGWGDSPLPTKLLLGRSSPSAPPRAARRGSLVYSATSGGPSYPSTKFLNGAHGEIAYSHLNNLKMAEQILLKLSPRTPLGAKPRLANFSPKRDLVQKRTRNWSWGGSTGAGRMLAVTPSPHVCCN